MDIAPDFDSQPAVFELHVEPRGKGCRLVAESDGARSEPFRLSAAAVRSLVRLGEDLDSGTLENGEPGRDVAPALPGRTGELVRKAGRILLARTFGGAVWNVYLRAEAVARVRGQQLRIEIHLPPSQTSLHQIPWELLMDGARVLALSSGTPVVRIPRREIHRDGLASEPPLRMLLTTAQARGTAPLGLEEEERAVRTALGSRRIELDVLHGVGQDSLVQAFQQARRAGRPYRIWHHGGHGRLESDREDPFQLVLERDEATELLAGRHIAPLVCGERGLMLVVLSLCHGGAPLGLAPHLAELDLPAVVGFRSRIGDRRAIAFARHFYGQLPDAPVDVALTRARQALAVDGGMGWAQPILYARAASLRLLPAEPAPATAPEPPPVSRARTTFTNTRIQARDVEQIGQRGSLPPHCGAEASFENVDSEFQKLRQVGQEMLDESRATDLEALLADLLPHRDE